MSWFSSVLKGGAKIVGGLLGASGGGAQKIQLSMPPMAGAMPSIPSLPAISQAVSRAMPGVRSLAAQAGFALPPKRRRGRGFSARDLRQTRRVMKMLKEFNSLAPRRPSASRRPC